MEQLRIIYSKSKESTYVEKEDLEKIFEEAFKRAKIEIAYFSKKPDLTFVDPLPIGIESTGEILETSLVEHIQVSYFIKQMNNVLPSGITVLSAEYLKGDNTSVEGRVYGSTYLIDFVYDEKKIVGKTQKQIDNMIAYYKEKMAEFLEQREIQVLKKSNNRMEIDDIKPYIIFYEFLIDSSLEISVATNKNIQIRPSDIMNGYSEYINEPMNYKSKRTKILYNN